MAGEAKLTDHGRQETRRDFLAEVFDDRLPGTVVERDRAPLAAFGFHPNGHSPRCAQLTHPLNEFPAFDPATIGQECPNSNHRLVLRPGRQGLYLPRYRWIEGAADMPAPVTTGRAGNRKHSEIPIL